MTSTIQEEFSELPQKIDADPVGVHWVIHSPLTLTGLVVLCDVHLADGVPVGECEYDASPVQFLMPKQIVIGEIRGQRPSLIVDIGVDVAEGEVPVAIGHWIQESLKVP